MAHVKREEAVALLKELGMEREAGAGAPQRGGPGGGSPDRRVQA